MAFRILANATFKAAVFCGWTVPKKAISSAASKAASLGAGALHRVNTRADTSAVFEPIIFKLRLDQSTADSLSPSLQELKENYSQLLSPKSRLLIETILRGRALTGQQKKDLIASLTQDWINSSGKSIRAAITQRLEDQISAAEFTDAPEERLEDLKEHYRQQTVLLGENVRDFLIFKVIQKYVVKLEDKEFSDLKTSQTALRDESAKKDFFINLLKMKIKESPLSFFFKNTVLILFPLLTYVIGRYSQDFIQSISDDFSGKIGNIEKEKLLLKATDCFTRYKGLLDKWKSSNRAKQEYLKEHASNQENLGQRSQKDLYEELTNEIVNRYFDLYDGPVSKSGPVKSLKTLHESISAFARKPVITNRRPLLNRVLNKFCILVKWTTLFLPSYLVISAAKLPCTLFESLTSYYVKNYIKHAMRNSKLINGLIESSFSGIYGNPYVAVITTFLAEQLKHLNAQLVHIRLNPSKSTDSPTSIPIATSQNIKSCLTMFLALLDANKIDVIASQPQSSLRDLIPRRADELIQTVGIENLISIFFKLYEDCMQERFLLKPLGGLFENLNRLLTSAPRTPDEAQIELHHSKEAEASLQEGKEKLIAQLSLMIRETVTKSSSESAQEKLHRIIPHLKELTNEKIREFTALFNDLIAELSVERGINFQTSYEKISTIQAIIQSLKAALSLAGLEELSEREKRPIKEKLEQLLEKVSTIKDSLEKCVKIKKDTPFILFASSLSRSLPDSMEDLQDLNDPTSSQRASFNELVKLLKNIQSQETKLEMDSTTYKDLAKAIRKHLQPFENAFHLLQRKQKQLADITQLLTIQQGNDDLGLLRELIDKKRALLGGRFSFFNSSARQEVQRVKTAILSSSSQLPRFKEAIESITSAQNETQLDAAITHLRGLDLNPHIAQYQAELSEQLSAFDELSEKFSYPLADIIEAFDSMIDQQKQAMELLKTAVTEKKDEFEALVDSLRVAPIVKTTSSLVQATTSIGGDALEDASRRYLNEFISGLLKISRDGIFAQFLVNHLIVIPFVEKSRS